MPRTYEQLTGHEREVIAQMHRKQASFSEIGRALGRPASTILREVRRNGRQGRYLSREADRAARERRRRPRRPRVLVGSIAKRVKECLARQWSPEQIQGRDLLEGRTTVSFMTIYRFLETPDGEPFRAYLRGPSRRRRQNRKNRERIHSRVMIDERPAEVEEKLVPGHWEGDTVRGPMRSSACMMTFVERTSQFLVARLLDDRSAKELNKHAAKAMRYHEIKTLTVDNGMEFASHQALKGKLKTQIYFAHERSPWERGLNEQVNGLIRQYFPKGTNLDLVSEKELQQAVRRINNRPRKTLGYKTPTEMMQQSRFALVK